MASERAYVSAAAVSGGVYIIGGVNKSGLNIDTVSSRPPASTASYVSFICYSFIYLFRRRHSEPPYCLARPSPPLGPL
eukprot:1190885-Prorocentrum_minimum.AAC.2